MLDGSWLLDGSRQEQEYRSLVLKISVKVVSIKFIENSTIWLEKYLSSYDCDINYCRGGITSVSIELIRKPLRIF